MNVYRFEIVRGFNDRFAWVFVVEDENRRRILARSTRDFRSRARAEKAIDKMRDAAIAPGVPGPEPFPLPTTSFQIVPGVVPLIVDDFPTEIASPRLRTAAAPVAEPPAKPKKRPAARKSKPRRRRTS
jgi:uncharacterized protein YegP (UPF0339 family)